MVVGQRGTIHLKIELRCVLMNVLYGISLHCTEKKVEFRNVENLVG